MVTSQDWVRVVVRLIKETSEGKVEWEAKAAPDGLTEELPTRVEEFYTTLFAGRHLGVYEERRPVWGEEGELIGRTRHAVLGLFDKDGKRQMEIPVQVGVDELLEAARAQNADADSFVQAVLAGSR